MKSWSLIPTPIWAIGVVSLFMGISLGIIHSLLPSFMVTVLGASLVSVGIIEGITEGLSLLTKIFAGTLSDLLGKRKGLMIFGYGLAAIAKPLIPLASSLQFLLIGRILDRIGRGLRGAPRDALISEIVPPSLRGSCFGLRQALGRLGVFVGPLLAILLMHLYSEEMRYILWLAVIPALISVPILIFWVKEASPTTTTGVRPILQLKNYWLAIKQLKKSFWLFLLISNLVILTRFSDAFLLLKAQNEGLTLTFIPLIFALINGSYALSAFPAGILSDRYGRQRVLVAGILILTCASILLGISSSIWMIFLGAICWGLHLGFCQGLFDTLVADNTPSSLRGFGYGLFYFTSGITTFLSSTFAGLISEYWSMKHLFLGSALLSLLAAGWLIFLSFSKGRIAPELQSSMQL